MHRWIQIEKLENIELSIMFLILSLGRYEYTGNKVLFEYHVDTIPKFQK